MIEEGILHLLECTKSLSVELNSTHQALLAQHYRSRLTDQAYMLYRELHRVRTALESAGDEEMNELKKEAKKLMVTVDKIEASVKAEDILIYSGLGLTAANPTNTITPPPISSIPQHSLTTSNNSSSSSSSTQHKKSPIVYPTITHVSPVLDRPTQPVSVTETPARQEKEKIPSLTNSCINLPNCSILLVLLCVLITYPVSCLASASPTTGISFFSLNANGMNNVLKVQHINTAIRSRNPSIFVISELKSKVPVAGRLPGDAYNVLEEKSEPTDGTWKWGVAMGIRKDIQLAQQIPVSDQTLRGRILVVDILLPSTNGRGFPHRIFGVYAPWDPGLKVAFWEKIMELCNSSPHSWLLIGDLNSTVSPIERASPENQSAYTKFLQDVKGLDVWKRYPMRNRTLHWTCRSKESTDGGNIIDRLVTSENGIIEAHVQVANHRGDYILVTDHRPIIAQVIPDVPNGLLITTLSAISLPKPRIRYLQTDRKTKFQQFKKQTEEQAEAQGLFHIKVEDNTSFLLLYDRLTAIFNKTAEDCFRRNLIHKRNIIRDVTSPRTEAIKAESRYIGGAILSLKTGNTAHISTQSI